MKALAFMKDAYISAMLEIYTNNFFITGIIKTFYIPIISGWETETVEMPIFPKKDSHENYLDFLIYSLPINSITASY